MPRVDLAVPAFGYKNHIGIDHVGIDRRHRLIRRWRVTDAARHDGALLSELIDRNNTAGDVWADTAYRSQANEALLAGRPPAALAEPPQKAERQADAAPHRPSQWPQIGGSSAVEHVFARQKGPMRLFVRTIGMARAQTKIGLANLLYNMQRMVWLTGQAALA
jgi:hypothetical protein